MTITELKALNDADVKLDVDITVLDDATLNIKATDAWVIIGTDASVRIEWKETTTHKVLTDKGNARVELKSINVTSSNNTVGVVDGLGNMLDVDGNITVDPNLQYKIKENLYWKLQAWENPLGTPFKTAIENTINLYYGLGGVELSHTLV